MTPAQPFAPSARVRRSDEQVFCTVDGSVVIMTLADGDYFELNTVGARIWDEIEEPIVVADLVSRLVADYDVDADTCAGEVSEWLSRMYDLALVRSESA